MSKTRMQWTGTRTKPRQAMSARQVDRLQLEIEAILRRLTRLLASVRRSEKR